MNLFSFPNQSPSSRLPRGYTISSAPPPEATELNSLLVECGEDSHSHALLHKALINSLWHISVRDESNKLVGFVRATSDKALNTNLWDLVSLPHSDHSELVLETIIEQALHRLKKELPTCSISLAALPEALVVLKRLGFVIDPDGIRAMSIILQKK
uniref:GNAT family acetyltransferase n=1 Tax=Paulinella chromatophora TaxID=39717 RepID=B1X519_PAUCH|nr:hypothetical protein PCC_0610 [Paulinella chromatophora]ACB43038.1 hypothetical protein PCC_0610 [Paulinella chromatophora]